MDLGFDFTKNLFGADKRILKAAEDGSDNQKKAKAYLVANAKLVAGVYRGRLVVNVF